MVIKKAAIKISHLSNCVMLVKLINKTLLFCVYFLTFDQEVPLRLKKVKKSIKRCYCVTKDGKIK